MNPTRNLAIKVAMKIQSRGSVDDCLSDYDLLRDHCDSRTGGELDCFQLDLLTGWVNEHLDHWAAVERSKQS